MSGFPEPDNAAAVGGDLFGALPDPEVVGIKGKPVTGSPSGGQTLVYSSGDFLFGLPAGLDSATNAGVSTPAVSSGAAFTPSAFVDSMVYFQLVTVAAGSYTLTMGPSSGAENTIASAVAMVAASGALVTLRVPATWKVILTLTTATLVGGTASVVGS